MLHWKILSLYKKLTEFFQKKISVKNINLGDFFFVKKTTFFLTSILEPLYFLKSCPNVDKLALPVFSKYSGFL